MKLGLSDLDPIVADVLHARVWQMRIGHQVRPEDAGARRVLARRWKGTGWRILAAIPIGAALGAGIATLLGGSSGDVAAAGFMTAYFGGIGTGVGTVLMGKFGRRYRISAEELRALSSGLQLGKHETIYLDSVCALMEAGDALGETDARDIISTLNALLKQARYVDDRLERMQKASSTDSLSELEADRKNLADRLGQISDPQARQDLEQSLAMCDERLRNARALAPLVERLDAQREVIDQTLLSVQSSISRLQVAPAEVAAPDVEEVKRIVTHVTAQTKAVEDAVQEVMAIRG